MKTKKAMILSVGLFLITLFAVSSALFFVSYKYLDKEPIGKKAFNIIKVYGEGEKYLFYIDQSAKYSAQNSAFNLAEKGGFYQTPGCEFYKLANEEEYALWSHKDKKNCFPDYKNEFSQSFNQAMDNYLNIFRPKESGPLNMHISGKLRASSKIPQADYSLFFDSQNLIGTAGNSIQISFYEEGSERESGIYSINPSFNINIGYDINEYSSLTLNSYRVVEDCSGEKETETSQCIKDYIKNNNLNWKFAYPAKSNERYAVFSSDSSYSLLSYNPKTKKIEYKTPVYKFALYFPEEKAEQSI